MSKPNLRPATEADVPAIQSLICELAEFAKMADQVTSDADSLHRALFGERPCAEALVAEIADEIVAFALFFTTYSTFVGRPGLYLEDVYVKPAHRGKRIGTRILKELARISQDRNYGRMDWMVLDWNQRAIDFYEKHGAKVQQQWRLVRTDAAGFEESSNLI